jgi:hypothetical protein
VVVNKEIRLKRIKCVFVCIPTAERGNIVLEQRLREIFGMKTETAAEE